MKSGSIKIRKLRGKSIKSREEAKAQKRRREGGLCYRGLISRLAVVPQGHELNSAVPTRRDNPGGLIEVRSDAPEKWCPFGTTAKRDMKPRVACPKPAAVIHTSFEKMETYDRKKKNAGRGVGTAGVARKVGRKASEQAHRA